MPSVTMVQSGEINLTHYHKLDHNIKSKPFFFSLTQGCERDGARFQRQTLQSFRHEIHSSTPYEAQSLTEVWAWHWQEE
jgi:hypothetical protein